MHKNLTVTVEKGGHHQWQPTSHQDKEQPTHLMMYHLGFLDLQRKRKNKTEIEPKKG